MLNSLKTTFQEVTKEVFKEAGKKVRRELDNWTTFRPSMSEDVSDCLEDHRGQPMKKLADLRLVVRQCKGLASGTEDFALDSYVVVQVEGATRSTAVMYRETDPVFNSTMNFNVRNLSGDVIIQVYNNTETMQGFGSRFIGQALIPVASLLPRLESSRVTDSVRVGNVGVGVEGEPVPTSVRTTLELELYPLPKDAIKFQQVPLEMRGDVKGLVRPPERLGTVEVEVTLALLQPLLETYLSASPPGPLSKRAALRISSGKDADEEDIDFNLLRWNALRIRDALCTPPSWWVLVKHIRAWHQPWLSAGAIGLLSSIALSAQLWQAPMLLSGAALLLGRYSGAARRVKRRATVSPWHEEIQSKRDKTLVAKALKGKALILKAQKDTGRIATGLERVRNGLNWADPNVSMVLAAAIAFGGAGLSVLCLVIQLLWPILPVRLLLVAAVVAIFQPPALRDKMEEMKLKVFGGLISDVRLGYDLSASRDLPPGTVDEDMEYVTIGGAEAATTEQNERDLGVAGHCILAISKLWATVPDELEMTHRTITRQQVKGMTAEILSTDPPAGAQPSHRDQRLEASSSSSSSSIPAARREDEGGAAAAAVEEPGRSPLAAGGGGGAEAGERDGAEAGAEGGAAVGKKPLSLRREEKGEAARRKEEEDKLMKEVMEEVAAGGPVGSEGGAGSVGAVGSGGVETGAVEVEWSAEGDAEMLEQEVQAAMRLSVSEIRAALRQCGGDASGLIEKAELARELATHRLKRGSGQAAGQSKRSSGGESAESAQRKSQLALLAEMGFADEAENEALLQRFNGDVDQVVKHVLKR